MKTKETDQNRKPRWINAGIALFLITYFDQGVLFLTGFLGPILSDSHTTWAQ